MCRWKSSFFRGKGRFQPPPPSSAATLCVQMTDQCWQNEAENETIPGTQTDPHLNSVRLEKEHAEALSSGAFPLLKMKENMNTKTDVEVACPSQPRKVTAGSLQDISKPWGYVYCWSWLLVFVSFLFLYRQRNRGNKLEFSPEWCRKSHWKGCCCGRFSLSKEQIHRFYKHYIHHYKKYALSSVGSRSRGKS